MGGTPVDEIYNPDIAGNLFVESMVIFDNDHVETSPLLAASIGELTQVGNNC